MKKTLFVKNAVIMMLNTILLRGAGIIFKIWVASDIGDEGMGIYSLVISVYMLCSCFASIGIATCVTRVVSDCESLNLKGQSISATNRCIKLCFIACAVLMPLLFFGNEFIATAIIKDSRAAFGIKLCGLSLPFVSICSSIKGYFIGKRKTLVPCLSQQLEQIIRIGATLIFLQYCKNDVSLKIAAITAGDVIAEFSASMFLLVFYKIDKRKIKTEKYGYKKLLSIAMPLCSSKYVNGILRTYESILVPVKLTAFYLKQNIALATVGIIKGMVLPILLFPYTILGVITTLLLPEMASANACRHKNEIRHTAERAYKITFIFGICACFVFVFFGNELGIFLYKNKNAGKMIKILAPLVPLMYIDSVSDALLKGLDKQIFTFKITVFDSLLRILLIYLILSSTGTTGFIAIMYFSNIFTSLLNLNKTLKTADLKIKAYENIIMPLLSAIISCLIFKTLYNYIGINNVYSISVSIVLCIIIYIVLLMLSGVFKNEKELVYKAIKRKA